MRIGNKLVEIDLRGGNYSLKDGVVFGISFYRHALKYGGFSIHILIAHKSFCFSYFSNAKEWLKRKHRDHRL